MLPMRVLHEVNPEDEAYKTFRRTLMTKSISIFDTTLRDGTQGEGISLSSEDKLKIAKKLDDLGVHYIEGGIPGSNNKDIEFFKRVKELHLNAKITAFGSTRRKNSLTEHDENLKRMIDAGVPAATLHNR